LLGEKCLATGEDLFCFLSAGHHEEVEDLIYLEVARKMFLAEMLSTNPLPVSQSWVFVHQQTVHLVSAQNT
jgi:hypothetical protein